MLTPPGLGPGVAGYGATGIPGPSLPSATFSSGGNGPREQMPRILTLRFQNVEVLSSLVKLTGQDFGFDIPAWQQLGCVGVPSRSDPGPPRSAALTGRAGQVSSGDVVAGTWTGTAGRCESLRLSAHERPATSGRDHRGWVRRTEGRADAAPRPGPGDPDRPPQSSPVPAAALPGGDGGADSERHRLADPPDPPGPAERRGAAGDASRSIAAEAKTVDPGRRRADRLRLPDRGDRRDPLVLRPRRVGARRARPEEHHRRPRDSPPRPVRVRGRRARARPRRGAAPG